MTDTSGIAPNFKEYEEGKHRRYELLFKVNGAAFAIVSLVAENKAADFVYAVLGLRPLAWGMCAFCLIMGFDIFSFGWNMKQIYPRPGKVIGKRFTPLCKGLFRPQGMLVLTVIIILLASGWAFVGWHAPDNPPQTGIIVNRSDVGEARTSCHIYPSTI
jgi:hypothetical protein